MILKKSNYSIINIEISLKSYNLYYKNDTKHVQMNNHFLPFFFFLFLD